MVKNNIYQVIPCNFNKLDSFPCYTIYDIYIMLVLLLILLCLAFLIIKHTYLIVRTSKRNIESSESTKQS